MFDLQGSADVLVEQPDAVVAALVDRLGFPAPRPRWIHDWPDHGYKAVHCRVSRDVVQAPTTVEVIGPGSYDPELNQLNASYLRAQAGRPMKTHGNVVGTAAFDEIIERLRSRGARFRLGDPSEVLHSALCFVGTTDDEPYRYDPSVDGGLWLEIIPVETFRLPPASAGVEPAAEVAEGALVRVASRAFIVDDLTASLRALAENIGWEPQGPVTTLADEGCDQAVLTPRIATSAAIEILQPTSPDSPVGRHYAAHGAGPYRIRVAVKGLAAKADDLRARGAAYRAVPPDGDPGRLAIDPASVEGLIFELIEA